MSTLKKISTILEVLDYIDSETTMFWDIDDTIMTPIDISGSDSWFYYTYTELQKKMDKDKAIARLLDMQYLKWQNTKFKLIEQSTAAVIWSTQSIAKTVICVTARGLLSCYNTIHWINNLGLTFASIDGQGIDNYIHVPVYESTKNKNSELSFLSQAGFLSGILFCGGHDEGDVLEKFVQLTNLEIKKIVFVNDTYSRLEEVDKYCKKHKIDFIGLHYLNNVSNREHYSKTMMEIDVFRKSFLKI